MAHSSRTVRFAMWSAGVAIVVVGSGVIAISVMNSGFEADRARMEALSLTQAAKTVTGKQLPQSWSAGAYISAGAVNHVVQGLRGVKVSSDPVNADGEDAQIEVKSFGLDFAPGFAAGAISLSAESKKRNLAVNLDGEATLTFTGVVKKPAKDGKEAMFAQFAVSLIKVEPDISWSGLRARFSGYAGDLVKTGLVASLAKNLKVEIPIKDTVGVDLKTIGGDHTLPVRDPKSENYVIIRLSAPPKMIDRGLSFEPPVFTKDGLWLLANTVETGKQASPAIPSDKDPTPSSEETAANRKVLAAIKPPEGNPDVLLWLQGKVITDLVSQLQSLPEANRTLTAQSVDFRGRLSDSGNSFSEFTGKDALNGSATLSAVSSALSDDKGLTISGHVIAHANAKVHVHFDPGIGGGLGTSIGLPGNAEIDARASAKTEVASADGHKLVLVRPEVECQPAVIEMKSDGKLSIPGIFKTDVPSIGAKVTGPLGAQVIPPLLAFSDLPFPLPSPSTDGGPLKVEAGGKHYLVAFPWQNAEVSVEPVSSKFDSTGLSISAKLKVDFPKQAPPDDREKTEAALLSKAIGSMKLIPCAVEPSFALTLGPFEFGPNGVITQVIKAFVDVNKTLDKAGQDTISTLKKADKDAQDTLDKAKRDAQAALDKARDDTKRFLGIQHW